MLDDFREWLSDNLRYILLGLAVILVLVIVVFAVRLVSGNKSSKQQQTESNQQTEQQTEKSTEADEDNDLVKNDSAIYAFATSYFTARTNQDYETLATLYESFDEKTQAGFEEQDEVIESFGNIMTYSKNGLTSGSYVVYVYYEVKFTGISTAGPTILEWYLITDSEGNLVIADDDSDEVKDFILQCRTDDDVQALLADVEQKLEEAKESDEELKAYVESSPLAGGDDDSDDSGANSNLIVGTMKASTTVNIRSEASTNGTIYGSLPEGSECEVLENLDSGWSKIQYTYNGVTIEGYVKSEYLTTVD